MNGVGNKAFTVLYVDDDDLARKYFAHAVPEFAVQTAADAAEALEILAGPACDVGVIVTDYHMPGQAGGQLLRQVEQQYPHIVRILVTAFADATILLDTVNGCEIFRILEKPLELKSLRSTLELAQQRARERVARRQSLSAIEETLAFLVHELNTPLAAISNFSRGIKRRSEALQCCPVQREEIAEAAALSHDNARYCMTLLSSFVDSVKHVNVAPATNTARARGEARALVHTLIDTYPMAASARAAISIEVQQNFVVPALPNCVTLVLSSILKNALHAIADASAPALRFTVLVDGHPQIRLCDNGPGIPPAVLERLQLDPVTLHPRQASSGWGLIFCNRIMQSFGGYLSLQSAPGAGTTATLNFPART